MNHQGYPMNPQEFSMNPQDFPFQGPHNNLYQGNMPTQNVPFNHSSGMMPQGYQVNQGYGQDPTSYPFFQHPLQFSGQNVHSHGHMQSTHTTSSTSSPLKSHKKQSIPEDDEDDYDSLIRDVNSLSLRDSSQLENPNMSYNPQQQRFPMWEQNPIDTSMNYPRPNMGEYQMPMGQYPNPFYPQKFNGYPQDPSQPGNVQMYPNMKTVTNMNTQGVPISFQPIPRSQQENNYTVSFINPNVHPNMNSMQSMPTQPSQPIPTSPMPYGYHSNDIQTPVHFRVVQPSTPIFAPPSSFHEDTSSEHVYEDDESFTSPDSETSSLHLDSTRKIIVMKGVPTLHLDRTFECMSVKEISDLYATARSQIKTENPFIDDYYSIVSTCMEKPEKYSLHRPLCEYVPIKNRSPSGTYFAQCLGRISVGTARSPRVAIGLDRLNEKDEIRYFNLSKEGGVNIGDDRKLLFYIEKIYILVIELEDLENLMKYMQTCLDNETQKRAESIHNIDGIKSYHKEKMQKILEMLYMIPLESKTEAQRHKLITSILITPKGSFMMYRLLRLTLPKEVVQEIFNILSVNICEVVMGSVAKQNNNLNHLIQHFTNFSATNGATEVYYYMYSVSKHHKKLKTQVATFLKSPLGMTFLTTIIDRACEILEKGNMAREPFNQFLVVCQQFNKVMYDMFVPSLSNLEIELSELVREAVSKIQQKHMWLKSGEIKQK